MPIHYTVASVLQDEMLIRAYCNSTKPCLYTLAGVQEVWPNAQTLNFQVCRTGGWFVRICWFVICSILSVIFILISYVQIYVVKHSHLIGLTSVFCCEVTAHISCMWHMTSSKLKSKVSFNQIRSHWLCKAYLMLYSLSLLAFDEFWIVISPDGSLASVVAVGTLVEAMLGSGDRCLGSPLLSWNNCKLLRSLWEYLSMLIMARQALSSLRMPLTKKWKANHTSKR